MKKSKGHRKSKNISRHVKLKKRIRKEKFIPSEPDWNSK